MYLLDFCQTFKCVVIGDAGIGKTSMLESFVYFTTSRPVEPLPDDGTGIIPPASVNPLSVAGSEPTARVLPDFERVVNADGALCRLHIWDSAGTWVVGQPVCFR